MSRFHYDGWDGEGIHPLMWEQTCRNALKGRKGQLILHELRDALLSLPAPRLIQGAFAKEGEVCALGALAKHRLDRGGTISIWGREAVSSLAALEEKMNGFLEDDEVTLDLGEWMGLKRALALAISYENDEGVWYDETPEQRFKRMLRWTEQQIVTREG
jgi:hypothetical protein